MHGSCELEQRDAKQWGAAKISFRAKFPGECEDARPRKFMQRRWDVQLTNYYSIREIGLPLPFTESTIFAVDCLSPIIGT